MIDLLVLTSLDQPIFELKILLTFLYKTNHLNEEVNCTELFLYVNLPWLCCIHDKLVFVLGKPVRPSLIFASKADSLSEVPLRWALGLAKNVRLG